LVLFDEIKKEGRRSITPASAVVFRKDSHHKILLRKRLAVKELAKVDNRAGRV
jgi:hypothetical protein